MVARKVAVPRRTVRVDGRNIRTAVTARPAVARRWVHTALWRERRAIRSAGGLTVGLGVQWTPPSRRLPAGAEPRPGTLQLCAGDSCLVFQLARAGTAPRVLHRFLAHPRITFAAYNVLSDRRKLRAHHGLMVRSTLELRGAAGRSSESLADMARRLLGMRGVAEAKPPEIGASEWDGPRLSRKQVRYAVVDAFVSCQLGVHLRRQSSSESEYSDDDDGGSTASESSSDAHPSSSESEYSDDDDDDDDGSTASETSSDAHYGRHGRQPMA